ncbi:flagellar hook-associated protein 1 FlgK [Rhodopseudomonas julia]|uniref:Flagellar hook-associated protein 1 n=1 Tax=Rhodopseudomonas julia TaxID=200617 RepID=A0ABU0C724_9BRAD|nr:flagellar hook-associated protein FlgK [Rhodopseudomonas julia]MDQ0326284.1 flagellar hook-associated protein 1 FlgK [Rhodopseudomonas julia]
MSLQAALTTARSSLQATAAQISVSAKNVSGAGDPTYSRKLAPSVTTPDGAVRVVTTSRATDRALYTTMLGATSRAASEDALVAGLNRLSATIGDPESEYSPAAQLSQLQITLQEYSNRPDDSILSQNVVTRANALTTKLQSAAETIAEVRQDADADIANAVSNLNSLLDKFETLNNLVVQGSFAGADVTDPLDKRDAVLAQISEQMGVSVVTRANNDMVLYTDSGATLFETTARSVTFAASPALTAGSPGNAVFVDGVPVTGPNATMPLHGGALVGLTTLRDDVALTYQNQLDEVARGLIEVFAESDQTGGGAPDQAGLFTYPGGPGVPASGTAVSGLAASITVNSAIDPLQGGTLSRLRDGGVNGAAYAYNSTGAAAFSDRLDALVTGMGTARSFDPATQLEDSQSLIDFTTSSSGWLEGRRQAATAEVEYQNTLVAHSSDALSNATGVNLDDEYALQLQLEQSYAASAKVLSVINELFDTLLMNAR